MSLLRLLYAEDNRQDADLTRAHFAEHAPDFAIDVVETGETCLASVARGGYDVLLADRFLPDMEGLDLLRALARAGATLPVVLVTAAGDEDLVVAAVRLGAADYVPKAPGYLDALPGLLREVVEVHRASVERSLAPNAPRRVLYVEHHEMDIELTSRHLAGAAPHLTLDVVRSFAEALERLTARPEPAGAEAVAWPPYDAVLLDLRMPGQSGLDFVHDVRRRGVPMPPFVLITGQGDEETAIASLRLGAADYVTKRDGYLDQLPHTIERAITHDRLDRLSRRLQVELAERERVQAQLLQAQRMEGIARLAGGVAHDFNNLLSVILTSAAFAEEALPPDSEARGDLQQLRSAAERAASLTRQLLAFSRKQLLQPVALSLNDVAAGLEGMFRRTLGEDVALVLQLAPGLGVVRADPAQIDQILMNLVVNARDAMPGGGKLTIETSNVEVDAALAARHPGLAPGPHVRLRVVDTGSGMDQVTKAKAFDPFFTTKEPGKGTGLGLAMVHGIVTQSGGSVAVDSEPGRGTSFEILLPREAGAAAARLEAPAPARQHTGTETILVVEDEPALRAVAQRSLAAAGYTVLSAADGEEALRVAGQYPGDIHLLFSDVVLPGMSGSDVARALLETRPRTRVLLATGYADDTVVRRGVLDVGAQMLPKPYTLADLTQRVRELLDDSGARPGQGAQARPPSPLDP